MKTARGSIGAHFKAKLSEKTISDYVWVFWQFSGDWGSKIKKYIFSQTDHNSVSVGGTIFLTHILIQMGCKLLFYVYIGDSIRNGESFSTNLHSMGISISLSGVYILRNSQISFLDNIPPVLIFFPRFSPKILLKPRLPRRFYLFLAPFWRFPGKYGAFFFPTQSEPNFFPGIYPRFFEQYISLFK